MTKKLWRMKLNTATVVLIPAAIGINYLGKLFAELLKLPLWLDSIGTCLAAYIAGPIVGAIVGAAINIIYGVMINPISAIYALTNVVIAITVGIFAHKGYFQKLRSVIFVGVVVSFISCAISTPLNLFLGDGGVEGVVGEMLLTVCRSQGLPDWIAISIEELLMEIPDKMIAILSVYAVGKILTASFLDMYQEKENATA